MRTLTKWVRCDWQKRKFFCFKLLVNLHSWTFLGLDWKPALLNTSFIFQIQIFCFRFQMKWLKQKAMCKMEFEDSRDFYDMALIKKTQERMETCKWFNP